MIIQRDGYLNKISAAISSVPIVILIGARQVGKTTLMNTTKVVGPIMKMHGQNPADAEKLSEYQLISRYLHNYFGETLDGTLMVDEFQYIPNIGTILKLLVDKFPSLKIICTGSSSLDIYSQMKESMAGRVRYIPVYPLSFREYLLFTSQELLLSFEKIEVMEDLRLVDPRIPSMMEEYMVFGGLPKIALAKTAEEKVELLTDIMRTYLLRDVRNYIRNEDFVGFNKVLRLLAAQIGGMININELSLTTGVAYRRCEEYIHILEQMFVLHQVHPFTTNKRSELTKMKKGYFFDNGIRNVIHNDFNTMETRLDNGVLFENFIYMELIRELIRPESVWYYRTRDGMEIDFILEKGGKVIPVEVKFRKYQKPSSLRSLTTFNSYQPFKKGYCINRNFSAIHNNIRFLPGYFTGKIAL
ncbi:MAG: ATP-binding protein [Bacteroidetes bacterium]|nr:ATP-binding protein [Bacteroidota bacterium]